MRSRLSRSFLLAAAMMVAVAVLPVAQETPALSKEQMREFLLNADIVKNRPVPKGVTRPVRLTLSDGTLTHDAVFQSYDQTKAMQELQGARSEINFVDSYRYNLAAYGLAELLAVDDMMPVHVERKWNGKTGSLSWLVPTLMEEGERLKKKIPPPDSEAWNRQMFTVRIFNQLVYDTDPNLTNILITPEWKIVRIDFTRAFRRWKELKSPADLQRCNRQLLERLKRLTVEQVEEKTKRYVSRWEIEALMIRRDKIVAHFEKLIAEKGEEKILY